MLFKQSILFFFFEPPPSRHSVQIFDNHELVVKFHFECGVVRIWSVYVGQIKHVNIFLFDFEFPRSRGGRCHFESVRVLTGVANGFFEHWTNDQHRFHVHFVFEVPAVEASFSERHKKQQFSFEIDIVEIAGFGEPFFDERFPPILLRFFSFDHLQSKPFNF